MQRLDFAMQRLDIPMERLNILRGPENLVQPVHDFYPAPDLLIEERQYVLGEWRQCAPQEKGVRRHEAGVVCDIGNESALLKELYPADHRPDVDVSRLVKIAGSR